MTEELAQFVGPEETLIEQTSTHTAGTTETPPDGAVTNEKEDTAPEPQQDETDALSAENQQLRHELAVHTALDTTGLEGDSKAIAAQLLTLIPTDQVADAATKLTQLTHKARRYGPPSNYPIEDLKPGASSPEDNFPAADWSQAIPLRHSRNR